MRLGDWYVFCDICGQRYFASEMTKLSTYTGRGGLLVCPHDVDQIDYGLVPYEPKIERSVPFTRVNHTDITDGAIIPDIEAAPPGVGFGASYISTSQGDEILQLSQEDTYIIAE